MARSGRKARVECAYYSSAMKSFFLLFFFLPLACLAQENALKSPVLNKEGTTTFHLRDPQARKVEVTIEGQKLPVPLTKDADGVWSGNSPVLPPAIYGYSFVIDGTSFSDPINPAIKTNLLASQSMFLVPGSVAGLPPQPWEVMDVPHGELHHEFYKSQVIGDERDLYVYTPPAYDARARKKYPVLYLLHGFSDGADGWTTIGKANFIFDNLIAQGKARQMVVVMPLGYGDLKVLDYGWGKSPEELSNRGYARFTENLIGEIIPMIEKKYRVSHDRRERAVAGLSMGGFESLMFGLNHSDRFSQVGAFSSGLDEDFRPQFPGAASLKPNTLKLLWIACGTDDPLDVPNRDFKAWLKTLGVKFTDVETPGAHTWLVWRRNLVDFAPLLFR